MMNHKRHAVAPVIATLLMVAIAVVGGMLVFVFAQDFFTSTDTMTGPTIEVLHIYGYDARDHKNDELENHAGDECLVKGLANGDLENGDVIALYVRNLGSQDVLIGDVSIFNEKGEAAGEVTLASGVGPTAGKWVINNTDICGAAVTNSGDVVPSGRDATILIAASIGTGTGVVFTDGDVKIGRPIFIKVETGAGNIFTKQLVNGRQIG